MRTYKFRIQRFSGICGTFKSSNHARPRYKLDVYKKMLFIIDRRNNMMYV